MGKKKTHICDGALVTYVGLRDDCQLYFKVNDEIPSRYVRDLVEVPASRTIRSLEVYNAFSDIHCMQDENGLFLVITMDKEFMLYSPHANSLVNETIMAVVADTRHCSKCREEVMARNEHPAQQSRVGVEA